MDTVARIRLNFYSYVSNNIAQNMPKLFHSVWKSGAHISSFMCFFNRSLCLIIRSTFSWWCSFMYLKKSCKIISYKEYDFSLCQSVLSIVHKIKNHQVKNKFINQGICAANFTRYYRKTHNPASIRDHSQVNCITVTFQFFLFVSYHIFTPWARNKYFRDRSLTQIYT